MKWEALLRQFKFTLQPVLKYRLLEEHVAQRDFYEVEQRLTLAQNQLAQLEKEAEEAHRNRMEVLKNSDTGHGTSQLHEQFIQGQKIKIQRKNEIIEKTKIFLEEKRLQLVQAVQNRKVLERLKEIKYLEFKKKKNIKERKEIDDIVVMRTRRIGNE